MPNEFWPNSLTLGYTDTFITAMCIQERNAWFVCVLDAYYP